MGNETITTADGGFSKTYYSGPPLQPSLSMSRTKFPLPSQIRDKIDINQLIRIRVLSTVNKELIDIEAVNQKPLSFGTAGEWKKPPSVTDAVTGLAGSVLGGAYEKAAANFTKNISNVETIADAFTRGVFGASTQSVMGSRQMWTGSEALKVTLHLRFEAYADAINEVYLPAMKLLSLPLPSKGLVKAGGADFFLIPPGPAPFPDNAAGKIFNAASAGGTANLKDVVKSTGEQVTIRFGGIMTLSRTLVRSTQVEWDQRCDKNGVPLAANIQLTCESGEVMTKESMYEAMLGTYQ